MEQGWLLASVIVFSLALSFLLSGMEAGVFALSRLRIRQFMRAGKPRAKVLHGYLEEPEDFLWTILVGNTLSNFVVFGLLVLVLHVRLGQRPVLFLAAFLASVFLFYTTCDLLPKTGFAWRWRGRSAFCTRFWRRWCRCWPGCLASWRAGRGRRPLPDRCSATATSFGW